MRKVKNDPACPPLINMTGCLFKTNGGCGRACRDSCRLTRQNARGGDARTVLRPDESLNHRRRDGRGRWRKSTTTKKAGAEVQVATEGRGESARCGLPLADEKAQFSLNETVRGGG